MSYPFRQSGIERGGLDSINGCRDWQFEVKLQSVLQHFNLCALQLHRAVGMQGIATTPAATSQCNFLIHHYFLRQVVRVTAKVTCNALCMTSHCTLQNFDECLKLVEQVLQHSNGTAEYALQIKALIQRQQGERPHLLRGCAQTTSLTLFWLCWQVRCQSRCSCASRLQLSTGTALPP